MHNSSDLSKGFLSRNFRLSILSSTSHRKSLGGYIVKYVLWIASSVLNFKLCELEFLIKIMHNFEN